MQTRRCPHPLEVARRQALQRLRIRRLPERRRPDNVAKQHRHDLAMQGAIIAPTVWKRQPRARQRDPRHRMRGKKSHQRPLVQRYAPLAPHGVRGEGWTRPDRRLGESGSSSLAQPHPCGEPDGATCTLGPITRTPTTSLARTRAHARSSTGRRYPTPLDLMIMVAPGRRLPHRDHQGGAWSGELAPEFPGARRASVLATARLPRRPSSPATRSSCSLFALGLEG